MKKMILVLILVLLAGCTDENTAYRVLDSAGYTNVTLTGWSAFACSKDDTFATGFKAIGPTGKPVSGVVCSAFLKGATIRLD